MLRGFDGECYLLSVSALPIAWLVHAGKKGQSSQKISILSCWNQVHELIPKNTCVSLKGDGEFDGGSLLATLQKYGWQYVCRTAKNTIVYGKILGKCCLEDLPISPGRCTCLLDKAFTRRKYTSVLATAKCSLLYEEPIYLVTNSHDMEDACFWYRKRFHIETFLSALKSQGFHLHQSHISDPARLSRLMIAACLAYIWIVYLGEFAWRT